MGKGSTLRKSEPEHLNGKGNGRKLVELDEMPEGCDPDYWHLSLYFVQRCVEHGVYASKTNGLPVVYEILKNRLTNFNPSAIRTRARTDGIQVHWVSIVEVMIDNYFEDTAFLGNDHYIIDDFTDVLTFEDRVDDAIETLRRKKLITRIPQEDNAVLPSRRTEEQQLLHDIRNRRYTEEELINRMREFRSRS